ITVKEYLRSIPNKGLGFGAFAASETTDFGFGDLPRVGFNYLGQFDGADEADWQVVVEESGQATSEANQDRNLLTVNGWVFDGVLQFNVSSGLTTEATATFASLFKASLSNVIAQCQNKIGTVGSWFTPSDFPFVSVGSDLLDQLQQQALSKGNRITHIYPATSLQQGFIYHAITEPNDDAYRVQLLQDYHTALDTPVYLQAWEACIETYPVLRTAFDWTVGVVQVVYEKGALDVTFHDISGLTSQEEKDSRILEIQLEDRNRSFDLREPSLFRLHIIKQGEEHFTILKNEHHSIADGWSGPVLLGQLHQFYDALSDQRPLRITPETTYLKAQEYFYHHLPAARDYWATHLKEVESANEIDALLDVKLPVDQQRTVEQSASVELAVTGSEYERLKTFTKSAGITVNTVVQFVWHKLLQVYSGSRQTIVGTTVSGRDLSVPGIENSVGLYINTLPLLVDWDNGDSIAGQLLQIQERLTAMNSHSFAHLARMQKEGERMFHSLLVFENYPVSIEVATDSLESGLSLRDGQGYEQTNYPLTLVV
ncbi:MAG: condensation domain-containing protein, partial [Bacteroidota bacterium]